MKIVADVDAGGVLDAVGKFFERVGASTPATVLTVFGFASVVLAGIALFRIRSRSAVWAFGTLALLGTACVIVGQVVPIGSDQYEVARPPVTAAVAFENLKSNRRVEWLIRMIPYTSAAPLENGKVDSLGPTGQDYTFVASYEELRGYRVDFAIRKTGYAVRPGQKVIAIIFPLRERELIPANARGVLQVILKLDAKHAGEAGYTPANVKMLPEKVRNTLDDTGIESWQWDKYQHMYKDFNEQLNAIRLQQGNASALKFMGQLDRDWHPAGYSMIIDTTPNWIPEDFQLIAAGENVAIPSFGARAFLLQNLKLSEIPGRVIIDFQDPAQQYIPDLIGVFPIPDEIPKLTNPRLFKRKVNP
jgi:hypothetical protein